MTKQSKKAICYIPVRGAKLKFPGWPRTWTRHTSIVFARGLLISVFIYVSVFGFLDLLCHPGMLQERLGSEWFLQGAVL